MLWKIRKIKKLFFYNIWHVMLLNIVFFLATCFLFSFNVIPFPLSSLVSSCFPFEFIKLIFPFLGVDWLELEVEYELDGVLWLILMLFWLIGFEYFFESFELTERLPTEYLFCIGAWIGADVGARA